MLKPLKSFTEQVHILIDRGMSVDNVQAPKGYLATQTD